MKTIDETIQFHLMQNGWYLGEDKIEVKDNLGQIDGIPIVVGHLAGNELAYYQNSTIFISHVLANLASLPQRRLAILHEYAHRYADIDRLSPHEKEYACDRWGLIQMIKSRKYNIRELWDAISLFGDIVDEEASPTHPSSQSRYKRLKSILKEYVS